MPLLPLSETDEQCEAITDENLLPGVLALCEHLGMADEPVEKFLQGSLPVYAVGDDHVLKLYPAADMADWPVESSVLRALDGRLDIATPQPVDIGKFDGWGYILMSRLRGVDLKQAWPNIPNTDRLRLARQLGSTLAQLQTVTAPGEVGPADWDVFIAGQRRTAADRQRRHELAAELVEQIPGFLDSVDLGQADPVLLHTEYMHVHVLARRVDGTWEPTGLLDFEPAMHGNPEYDLAAAGIFLGRGDRPVWREFLAGYGRLGDDGLARRVLAYCLLHRFANLPWYLREVPAPGIATLDDLAEHWFGTDS